MKPVTKYFEVTKSPSDLTNEYRAFRLANEMNVVVVSNPESETAAAALSVGAGSWTDPDDVPGLFHFLEHMLFLGTEKYPEHNEYSQFISKHGGGENAYTSAEETNYHFSITAQHLEGALDRFSQFFVAPLFNAEYAQKEIKAVDSEFSNSLTSASRRLTSVMKQLSNPECRFHRFTTGNTETLATRPAENGVNIRELLLEQHKKYYSANLMRLVVIGRESLDELEALAVKYFSAVRNNNVSRPSFGGVMPFLPEHLTKRFYVVPLHAERRSLIVGWAVPPARKHVLTKPLSYVARLLGHEGKGSMLALLRHQGLANDLVAYTSHYSTEFTLVKIEIALSIEGMEQIARVEDTVFQYLSVLREAPVSESIWAEMKVCEELGFKYIDQQQPYAYARRLAARLGTYEPEHLLDGPYVYDKFDAELVRDYISRLTPQNSRVYQIGAKFSERCLTKTPWYNTAFDVEDIDSETLARWTAPPSVDARLHLPAANEFIPSDFALRDEPSGNVPKRIQTDELIQVWHMKDDEFKLPRTTVRIVLHTPHAYTSPLDSFLSRVLLEFAGDQLSETAYDAVLVDFGYDLTHVVAGISIELDGYNSKMAQFLELVVGTLINCKLPLERFDRIVGSVKLDMVNEQHKTSHRRAHYLSTLLTSDPKFSHSEKLAVVDQVTHDRLVAYRARILEQISVEMLIEGNTTEDEALEIASALRRLLPAGTRALPFSARRLQRSVLVPSGVDCLYQRQVVHNEPNSAVYNTYQSGSWENLCDFAYVDLLRYIMHEPCFAQLRTRDQLGYIVYASLHLNHNTVGLTVGIQSKAHDSATLDQRIEAWLPVFRQYLVDMTDETFAHQKRSLQIMRKKKQKSISAVASKHWTEVRDHSFIWDRYHQEAEIVGSITKDELVSFYDRYVLPSHERRKLSVQLFGKNHTMPDEATSTVPESPVDLTYSNVDRLVEEAISASGDEGSYTPPTVRLYPHLESVFRRQMNLA